MKGHIHFLVLVFRAGCFLKWLRRDSYGEGTTLTQRLLLSALKARWEMTQTLTLHFIRQHRLIITYSGFLTTARPEKNHQVGRHIFDVLCINSKSSNVLWLQRTQSLNCALTKGGVLFICHTVCVARDAVQHGAGNKRLTAFWVHCL